MLVSAPKADGEGGVYSCPFDVQGTCQFQGLFQNKIGGGALNYHADSAHVMLNRHILCTSNIHQGWIVKREF